MPKILTFYQERSYLGTRYGRTHISLAHSSEIVTYKNFILQEKSLDNTGKKKLNCLKI